ncbi:MAG: DEAD/DEAH box helicase [Bacteroidota bacterium]
MSKNIKNQRAILQKLGIGQLNPMQQEAQYQIHANAEVVLLSPTGTGKTIAFLLPIMAELEHDLEEVQALILAPSRELAIQIEQVAREMGTGHKINLAYGGRSFSKDKTNLKHRPALLIGTPGRLADHLRRHTFPNDYIKTLVLDEFDKSLEIGFESEMKEIISELGQVQKKILTSATESIAIPDFVKLKQPVYVNYLAEKIEQLAIKIILSPSKDKLETLAETLIQLGDQAGIIFCNFKDSIRRISAFLFQKNIPHGCFYGGMEQQERERALIKFRNGTHQLLLATDLAARGIDVPEIKFIIHYHLPLRSQEFTHRNGRTARMQQDGTAYVLKWKKEDLPDFIEAIKAPIIRVEQLPQGTKNRRKKWETIMLSSGRKDKISKGDIVGFFLKQGKLDKEELGKIELKQDCAFVAINSQKAASLLRQLNGERLKKKKVKLSLV